MLNGALVPCHLIPRIPNVTPPLGQEIVALARIQQIPLSGRADRVRGTRPAAHEDLYCKCLYCKGKRDDRPTIGDLSRLERTLCAGHALLPRIDLDGGTQRTGDALENRLADVMIVAAIVQ